MSQCESVTLVGTRNERTTHELACCSRNDPCTLFRLATPNVLVMSVQASVGLIETYFVARLGIDALAGVALVFPVLMLMQTMSAVR